MLTTTPPRVAIIGAGSFVFTLGLLYDLTTAYPVPGSTLVLMDIDGAMADVMARIARRMAADAGTTLTIEATDDRAAALAGADYVTTSVAAQIRSRWETDKAALHRHGIREITSECGGVGGLSYTLRQASLLLDIAHDMARLCPDAWLLNVSNPLPRVVGAVTRHTAIKTLGFCNASWGSDHGYENVAGLLGRDVRDINAVSGGLNHFAWLLDVTDRWTGEDLRPAVDARLAAAPIPWAPVVMHYWRETGYFALTGDEHMGEFVPFEPTLSTEHVAHHGDATERAARRQALQAAADGTLAWQTLMHHRAWERPAEVIHALATGTRRRLDMVNLPNRGAIAGLPDDAVVETPAVVAGGTVTPLPLAMPDALADLWTRVSAVHGLAADAAATGDRTLLAETIDRDPAITDKRAAHAAIADLLDAHADLLPRFAE
jgi:alpha-galactosidase